MQHGVHAVLCLSILASALLIALRPPAPAGAIRYPEPSDAAPELARGRTQMHAPAHGEFYRISVSPFATGRAFSEIEIERTAPAALAPPAPFTSFALPIPLTSLTGDLLELPEHARLYFSALDTRGAARLFQVDLTGREMREVAPPPLGGAPLAVRALAGPDARRLYTMWLGVGPSRETQIYDANLLQWVGGTREFAADPRASGFEHRAPYLWTFDFDDRLVQVDAHSDRVVRTFDLHGRSTAGGSVVVDAWRDLALVRTAAAGRDRFRVADLVSGESGPPIDVPGDRAAAHLALAGRVLVRVDAEYRGFDRRLARDVYTATGAVAVWDLRSGRRIEDLHLALPPDYPVSAVGARSAPVTAGRLWIYGAGDRQELELDLPACDRRPPSGAKVRSRVGVDWPGAGEPVRYDYTVAIDRTSPDPAWAFAVAADRAERAAAGPPGWGIDRLKDDRWIRWTNGLGPADENVAPGASLAGFRVQAEPGDRPGIVEYRVQAATGLPRGCESDDDFLENSASGHTIGPERIESGDPADRAKRLARLVERVCRLEWIAAADCEDLRPLAAEVVDAPRRTPALDRFRARLRVTGGEGSAVRGLLEDAAAAVEEVVAEAERP